MANNKGLLGTLIITNDSTLDFSKISRGNGVYHLSLSNVGDTLCYIDDASQEVIQQGDVFVIESPVPIVNSDFKVCFVKENQKQNKVIARYITAICLDTNE